MWTAVSSWLRQELKCNFSSVDSNNAQVFPEQPMPWVYHLPKLSFPKTNLSTRQSRLRTLHQGILHLRMVIMPIIQSLQLMNKEYSSIVVRVNNF